LWKQNSLVEAISNTLQKQNWKQTSSLLLIEKEIKKTLSE
jgi:hypothetical protein